MSLRSLIIFWYNNEISNSRKHQLLSISRSYKYNKIKINSNKEAIKKRIQEIAVDDFMCVYGEKKVWRQLLSEGYKVSLNTVSKYKKRYGIKSGISGKTSINNNTK